MLTAIGMRALIALVLVLVVSACCEEPEPLQRPFIDDPPALPAPTFDANGCLSAEQIDQLIAELEAARLWQNRAERAIERCYGDVFPVPE